MTGTTARLEKVITLEAAEGHPYHGQVNTQANTGETITDLNGTVLPASPSPEGLVAAEDGTFWVSAEHGPFITHFDAKGRQLCRLSPFDGSLPAELADRVPNTAPLLTLTALDPTGGYFGHDKIEGVATVDGGRTLLISNDNDFGIPGLANSAPPFHLAAKILPNGQQDDGEYLSVDTTKLSDPVDSATVSIYVVPADVHVQH